MNQYKRYMIAASIYILAPAAAAVAQDCTKAARVEGNVVDPTGAAIVGATVQVNGREQTTTDSQGRYAFSCIAEGTVRLTADYPLFQQAASTVKIRSAGTVRFDIHMALADVRTTVEATSDPAEELDATKGIGLHELAGKEIQQLPDDPDDMKRELQILGAAHGGIPGQVQITVDGFNQSSSLPPKSSIARIVTAPDLFSAQYDSPPYTGGRVEIFTKPGSETLHGSAFFTNGDKHLNATDPFSTAGAPAGKESFGFALGGPIRKTKAGFSLAFEKRTINEYSVINATTLDANYAPMALHQAVAAPQTLWSGTAHADWQVSAGDALTATYTGNVRNLSGQGIGGMTTTSAGYDVATSEHVLRLTNMQTIGVRTVHQSLFAWSWNDAARSPYSTQPAVSVPGYFQSGGNTSGYFDDRRRQLEVNDNLSYAAGRHMLTLGAQSVTMFERFTDPDNFNGSFTFGGGAAPELDSWNNPTGRDTVVSPLEQYRRALLNLPGGTPTLFQITTGTSMVPFTRSQIALYAQDSVKVSKRVTLSAGLRYAMQTSPGSYANIGPRIGLAWSLDKRAKTVLRLHAGLFDSVVPTAISLQTLRLNGSRQEQQLVYSPSFTEPFTPTGQSQTVRTAWTAAGSLPQVPSLQTGITLERDFPHHWHVMANWYHSASWGLIRSRNVNAPAVAESGSLDLLGTARPIAPNANLFEYEATGHLTGDVLFLGLQQFNYRRFGLFLGYMLLNFKNDVPNGAGFAQSAYSMQGEAARPDWQAHNRVISIGYVNLPKGVELSAQMDAQSGMPYNVVTGADNNGDGIFNDRPSWAASMGPGVYSTPFGLLSVNTVNGNVPRNLGTMPVVVHLDMNLSRTWRFETKRPGFAPSLALNLRSANALNHTNISMVNPVVSSPAFSQPIAAESARRLEFGIRVSF